MSLSDQRTLRCLISAGPTREHLDPVRFFSNGSSGKMGYALAQAAVARGWSVDLVSGPVSLAAPAGVRLHRVVSAEEMALACDRLFPECDILIMAAAVADYRPREIRRHKMKKADAELLRVELVPTRDILTSLAERRTGQVLVGFAAETTDLEGYARKKLAEKGLDWIAANDVSRAGLGMEADDNQVLLLSRGGDRTEIGPGPKREVAEEILNAIAAGLSRR